MPFHFKEGFNPGDDKHRLKGFPPASAGAPFEKESQNQELSPQTPNANGAGRHTHLGGREG